MVRQTKRFKKGLNKKVLSAILAASMIMTSSSFAFAGTNETEPLNEETQVNAEVQPTTGMEELGDDLDLTDDAVENNAATFATPEVEQDTQVDAQTDITAKDVVVTGLNDTSKGDWITPSEVTYEGGNQVKPEITIKHNDYTLVNGQDYHLTYSNNTDVFDIAGYATVLIEFDGNTYGNLPNRTIKFKIMPLQVTAERATVIYATEENLKYNGEKQYPEVVSVTIQDGEEFYELSPDDYEVVEKYDNRSYTNVNKVPYTIQVVGKGNYTGILDEKEYYITPAELSNDTTRISVDLIAFVENKTPAKVKQEIEESLLVYDESIDKYVSPTDYEIRYLNEKTGEYTAKNPSADMGVHQMRIYGLNNYDSNSYVDATYEIVKENSLQMAVNDALGKKGSEVGDLQIIGSGAYTTYNGKDQFVDNDELVLPGLSANQYSVTTKRADWTNAGTYYITLEGKNNFKGDTATIPVYVESKALNKDAYEAADTIQYTVRQGTHRSGSLGSVTVIVKDTETGKTLQEGVDYTFDGVVTEAYGTRRAVITGIGNYTTHIKNTTVYKQEINTSEKLFLDDESITAEVTKDYVYTGKPIEPTASNIKLVEKDGNNEYEITDADFYVSGYKNNKNAGEATVTITAKDSSKFYAGSRDITFKIAGLAFEDTFELATIGTVEKDTDWDDVLDRIKVKYLSNGAVYDSYDVDHKGSVYESTKCVYEILKDGKRVTDSDLNGKISEAGTYTIKVTPKDSRYAGELEADFTVAGYDIAENATVSAIEDQVYTGEAIEPEVTVKDDNKTLIEGKDYTVSYSGNVEGGTAVAIITGIGDYSGTIEKKFTITQGQQKITMTNPLQERDLKNGTRTTTSKACTLKLGYALEDKNLNLTYATSDPSVATVSNGKITYQGVGECIITVTANETNNCKADTLEIQVKVGKPGTPTFTPTVTKNTAKKAFVVTSSTVKGAEGFEVQYSIRSDWWKATTKDFDKVSAGGKLYRQTLTTYHSNRTYFVRVRAYEVVDGQKVYSDWSPVKTVLTK